MSRPTLYGVQELRFCAAISIVVLHSDLSSILLKAGLSKHPLAGGVDLFFVISGFIMTWLTKDQFGNRSGAWKFLLRRTIRILPIYWFFTSLLILMVAVKLPFINQDGYEFGKIIASYGFFPWPDQNGYDVYPIIMQGWTLNYEMFFYVTFALALCTRRGMFWFLVTFFALSALHFMIPKNWIALRFYTSPIILEFVAGIGIGRLYLSGYRTGLKAAIIIFVSAVLAFFALQLAVPRFDGSRFLHFGIPATFLFASVALRSERTKSSPFGRALQRVGDASYSMYLSHTFTLIAVGSLWRKSGFETGLVSSLIAIALVVVVSLIFYSVVERPITNAMKRALPSFDQYPQRLHDSRQ
jgi:exopolysaccharide production protein ExoZ